MGRRKRGLTRQGRPGDNAKEESKLRQSHRRELPPDPIRASLERKPCPLIRDKGDGEFPRIVPVCPL